MLMFVSIRLLTCKQQKFTLILGEKEFISRKGRVSPQRHMIQKQSLKPCHRTGKVKTLLSLPLYPRNLSLHGQHHGIYHCSRHLINHLYHQKLHLPPNYIVNNFQAVKYSSDHGQEKKIHLFISQRSASKLNHMGPRFIRFIYTIIWLLKISHNLSRSKNIIYVLYLKYLLQYLVYSPE